MEKSTKRAIALGFFDGVHLGHQALLRKTMDEAKAHGLAPAVFTFDRSPREFVTGKPVPLLTTVAERRRVVEDLFPGMEVIVAPFDREMMETPWEEFVLRLTQKLNGGWFVAGHDFRFGARNTGDAALLREKAAELGLGCDIIPAVLMDGQVVSSTRIRGLLEKGDAETAAKLLGRPFAMEGVVRHGRGLGHKLGTPTLNTFPPEGQLIPAYGVYASWVESEGRRWPAVTNIGVRPTVDEDAEVLAESHLLNETVQLYGSTCRVEFLKFLRPEQKFADTRALGQQIARDADEARAYFAQQNHA